jgi:cardiolipin synthase
MDRPIRTGNVLLPQASGPAPRDGVNTAPGSDDDGWIATGPAILGDGSRVQLYKDGEALHAAYGAIERARHRVCLEVYIWGDDDTGRAFADLLMAKARHGVRVHVIYDSVGTFWTDRSVFHRMRRAGVEVLEFHPVRPWDVLTSWRPVQRNHRKLLLIDDHIAGLGGLNLAREYAGTWVADSPSGPGTPHPWRDNGVGIVGPGAGLFLRSFARTWNYVVRGGPMRRAELQVEPLDGDLGLLASVPTMASPLVRRLHELMSGARESIELTMAYFAPPEALVDDLCGAAQRGVQVRLMLPSATDVRLLLVAARSFYQKLLAAGVEIYERRGAVLHAKTLLVDRQTTVIGSSNLDYRSIEKNFEISAVIRSKQFGEQIHDLFEHDVRFARRISKEEWRRRPMLDRLGQWAVSRARYLL